MLFPQQFILILLIYYLTNILANIQSKLIVQFNGEDCKFIEDEKQVIIDKFLLRYDYYFINVYNARVYYLYRWNGDLCKNIQKSNFTSEVYENVRKNFTKFNKPFFSNQIHFCL